MTRTIYKVGMDELESSEPGSTSFDPVLGPARTSVEAAMRGDNAGSLAGETQRRRLLLALAGIAVVVIIMIIVIAVLSAAESVAVVTQLV